jgi:hypothetical protein
MREVEEVQSTSQVVVTVDQVEVAMAVLVYPQHPRHRMAAPTPEVVGVEHWLGLHLRVDRAL